MSLVTGQVVYASLAQLSVKGAMDAKLSQLSVGMLDVFSSAFWTHPAFAHSVIRNCDEELSFTKDAAGVRIFQPPRSMDVVYNMFAVVDLPGLVNIATYEGRRYEIISNENMIRTYTGLVTKTFNEQLELDQWLLTGDVDDLQDATKANLTVARIHISGGTSDVDAFVGGSSGNLFLVRTDKADSLDFENTFPGEPADPYGKTYVVTFQFSGLHGTTPFEITDENSGANIYKVNGNPFIKAEHMPHYVNAVGQYLIQDVEMTIGGARVAFLNSMYMYIHEELFGMPGRRQQDAIGKTGDIYDPETDKDSGTADLERKSMMARRLYVQLPFWWTGGKMERALKTIALQLHKIEFKITTRRLADCIAYASFSTERLPKASASGPFQGIHLYETDENGVIVRDPVTNHPKRKTLHATELSFSTEVRKDEHISASVNDHLIGPVRKNAQGGDVAMSSALVSAGSSEAMRAYLQVDFCGIFLNQTSRDMYLKLDEKTLFSQVLGTDTTGIPLDSTKTGIQTETLNFSNAVYDVMVAVQDQDAGSTYGDVFGLQGTSQDAITKLRDDALSTLSFDISSTPRTINNLSAEYFRTVTQYQAAKTTSNLKGLYYWNVQLFDELNGTRCVNSYINASKIDDLRARFRVNNGTYSGKQLLEGSGSKIYFYAHVYNTLQIRNGMAGAMFA